MKDVVAPTELNYVNNTSSGNHDNILNMNNDNHKKTGNPEILVGSHTRSCDETDATRTLLERGPCACSVGDAESPESCRKMAGGDGSVTCGNSLDFSKEDPNAPSSDNRETWGGKIDFLLSIIGFAVDLANVWRFPYLCYRNGGGAFLIPYFLMLIFGAVPLFFMELVLGQFHRLGAISVWKIAPLFKGIGMAECLIAYMVAFYYNVIIAWSFFYLCASFTRSGLPWVGCNNSWNTPSCYTTGGEGILNSPATNVSSILLNATVSYNQTAAGNVSLGISSAAEYFERGVLQVHKSAGIHDLGAPRWSLTLCLFAVFTILYFSLWKGVKSSGKVVWVTATMPYIVLSILLVRGATLPGSLDGVLYFITPKLDRLGDPQVWIDAAVQIFYSVGAGFGTHLAYSSYNKFNNNCYRDCLVTVGVNSFTSLFSGFVVFSYLGYMAVRQNTDIANVAKEGPGLVFIVYPEAIATLPGSVAWAIIFFLMLLTLGLDSAMGGLEAVLTGLKDEMSGYLNKYKYGREIFTALICLTACIFAIPNVTYGGIYLFALWDTFAAGTSLLLCVFFQAVAVSWVYGLPQFSSDIKRMLGFHPGWYWRICWKIISPLFLLTIIIASLVSASPLKYESSMGVYTYPWWANMLGWFISGSSIALIPIAATYQIAKARGPLSRRLGKVISPEWEHRGIEQGQDIKRFRMRHWLSI